MDPNTPDAAPAKAETSPATKATPARAPAPQTATAARKAVRASRTRDALDHDGDGRKGGSAPTPSKGFVVVTKDDKGRALQHGEVLAVSPADSKTLLKAKVARPATHAEVELAQPRVRPWTSA